MPDCITDMQYKYNREERKREYQIFLASTYWKNVRNSRLELDEFRCKYCGSSKQLQAHHVLYPQDWYQTTTDHLITLCRTCHEKQHGINGKSKKEKRKRVKRWRQWKKEQSPEWQHKKKYGCTQEQRVSFLKQVFSSKKEPDPF